MVRTFQNCFVKNSKRLDIQFDLKPRNPTRNYTIGCTGKAVELHNCFLQMHGQLNQKKIQQEKSNVRTHNSRRSVQKCGFHPGVSNI